MLEWLVVLMAIGVIYTGHPADQRRYGRGPVPVPAPVHHARASRCLHSFPSSAFWCRWWRSGSASIGQQRTQPAHAIAHPGAADLRDALLFGKFLAGLLTIAISLVALWLLVIGLGLLSSGLPPGAEEVSARWHVCW